MANGNGPAKALDHAIKRWPALMCYMESGSLLIDNNPVNMSSALSRLVKRTRCLQALIDMECEARSISCQ